MPEILYDDIIKELREERINAHILNMLLFDWPASQKIIFNFCNYFSNYMENKTCNKNRKVLMTILETALYDYSNVLFHNQERMKFADPIRISVFLQSIIAGTCQYKNKQGCCDEKSFRIYFYQQVVSENIKNVLRRSNYEEAVVCGSVAIFH